MENWLDKYKPKNISQVLGDANTFKRIDQFVKLFTKKKIDPDKINCPSLLICGTNGIGKTLITDLILAENSLEKITADLSNIAVARKTKRKKKTEKETIGQNRSVKTFYMSLENHKNLLPDGNFSRNKIALVFDNVSNISNTKERDAVKAIVKMNNKLKKFPIIIIANTKHSKIVTELRKMVTYSKKSPGKSKGKGKKKSKKIINEIILREPPYNDVENFVKNICKKEDLRLIQHNDDDDDIFVELIDHAQHDIRRLINILEQLKMTYGRDGITLDIFQKFCQTSKTKDKDPGIYKATGMLLDGYTTINDAISIYGEERATIPLMVHENYPLNIRQQYPEMSVRDQINTMYDISRSISESDKVDGLIYSNQCWNLQPVHGFYSCVLPSYIINRAPNKLRYNVKYEFTQDYNKTSIKKINNKVIKRAQENQFLKKVSIHDFLYMASILKTLFERKDLETICDLMKPYELKLKEIESIIKIDKIKKSKNAVTNKALTGKQKTLLKEMLGVDE